MSYQLVINVSSPSILSSLKKVLGAMEGVTVERNIKSKKKSETEIVLADDELMESINRGKRDLEEGKSRKFTSSEINSFLGL